MSQAFSNLMKQIQAGRFVFTGELEPHKTIDLSNEIQQAQAMKAAGIAAANVTDNPRSMGYISSLAAAYIIQRESGLELIYQLRTADRNRLALTSDVLGAAALGIRNILAITGDHTKIGDNPQALPVFDLDSAQLVNLVHKLVHEGKDLAGNQILGPKPQLHVGVVANPGQDPLEMEILKLERKVEAGAEFIQTQVVFDLEIAERFLDQAKHLGIPILLGVFPARTYGLAEFFDKNVPGVKVPKEYLEKLQNLSSIPDKSERRAKINQYNVEYFTDFIQQIKHHPGCKGCHLMAVGYLDVIAPIVEQVSR